GRARARPRGVPDYGEKVPVTGFPHLHGPRFRGISWAFRPLKPSSRGPSTARGLPRAGPSSKESVMSLRLGDVAPDFTAESTEGTIKFHDWIGDSWAILFSHPKD